MQQLPVPRRLLLSLWSHNRWVRRLEGKEKEWSDMRCSVRFPILCILVQAIGDACFRFVGMGTLWNGD